MCKKTEQAVVQHCTLYAFVGLTLLKFVKFRKGGLLLHDLNFKCLYALLLFFGEFGTQDIAFLSFYIHVKLELTQRGVNKLFFTPYFQFSCSCCNGLSFIK